MKFTLYIIPLVVVLIVCGCATTPSPRADVLNAQWLQAALNHANTVINDVQLPSMDRKLTLDDYRVSISNVSIHNQRIVVARFELRDKELDVGLGFPHSFAISVSETGELDVF